jgi:hypothetical protein
LLLVSAVGTALAGQASTAQTPPARDPRIPAIFVPPEPIDYQDHEGWTCSMAAR